LKCIMHSYKWVSVAEASQCDPVSLLLFVNDSDPGRHVGFAVRMLQRVCSLTSALLSPF